MFCWELQIIDKICQFLVGEKSYSFNLDGYLLEKLNFMKMLDGWKEYFLFGNVVEKVNFEDLEDFEERSMIFLEGRRMSEVVVLVLYQDDVVGRVVWKFLVGVIFGVVLFVECFMRDYMIERKIEFDVNFGMDC